METYLTHIKEFLQLISWPIVALIGIVVFWRPLSIFLEALPARTKKLTFFDFSIEFATFTRPSQPWGDRTQDSSLVGGAAYSSQISELLQQMHKDISWDYLIVDIKSGDRWFLSRLFLFSVMLQYVSGLKCIVFVETRGKYNKRLLGLAEPSAVRIALAKKYPWFEQALSKACSNADIPSLSSKIKKNVAQDIVNIFMQQNNIIILKQSKLPADECEWEQYVLDGKPVWEHTFMLNVDRFNDDLREACFDNAYYVDYSEITANERNRELSCRTAPYIALVNERGGI